MNTNEINLASGPAKQDRVQFLGVALLSSLSFTALALPDGGQISAGTGGIATSGSAMTVTQQSQNIAINWQSFGIGASESVSFAQPNASAIALNRVLGADPSQIFGTLSASGQVWLLNPNGVLFGSTAQVNVGGLVASTLNISDADFLAGKRTLSGNGGVVTNHGSITAADGGYVALLGGKVSNEGVIQARLGTVALGAGNQVTLDFAGDKLINLQVDQGAVYALAENKQLIRADGGTVLLSARAVAALLDTVVNNTGIIEARTIDTHNGTIKLLGGMEGGTVKVAGTLDASAPSGGDGGLIETSGAQVKVSDSAVVTTAAPDGQTGLWLIDPHDYTVAASGGDITGTALGTALGSSNVQIHNSSGSAAGAGNVNVNDAVSWSADTTLTLTASNNVNVNADITASGANAGIALNPNTANGGKAASGSGQFNLASWAAINLPNVSPTSTMALVINGISYTVINSLGVAGSTTGADLQGMNGNMAGHYALGSNIDASGTSGWNSNMGFLPVAHFTGTFDGLGHTITGLTVNRPASDYVGLFGEIYNGVVQNVGLVGGAFSGNAYVGGLVGNNFVGTVSNSYSTATVSGSSNVGGLIGSALYSTVSNSYSTGAVSGGSDVGGLVGANAYGLVSNSYSTGAVSASNNVGGLVGHHAGTITDSHSTGTVNGTSNVGGLVGRDDYSGYVSNSYSTGAVSGDSNVGGLVGYHDAGAVSNSYSTGAVSGSSSVGGLVGRYDFGTVSNSYSTGSVSGTSSIGGLVGCNLLGISTGAVNGSNYVGGLVGYNDYGIVSNSYSTGAVSGSSDVGGLVGYNNAGTVSNSYWDITTSGQTTSAGGTGLTDAQMMQQASFVGFDFTNTWLIYEGHTYPLLRSFLTPLTVTADNISKTYDGLSWSGPFSGVSYSDPNAVTSPHLLGTSTPYGNSRNAGTYYPGLWSDQQGYDISYVNGVLTVNPASLTIAAATDTKVYDGTTSSAALPSVTGLTAGDSISGASQAFTSKNVLGTNGSTLNVTGYTLNDGNGGANYIVSTPTAAGTITPAALSIVATTETKVYDGTTSSAAIPSVTGLIAGDSISGASQAFTSKNVLGTNGSTLSVAGYTLSDGNGGANYIVSTPTASGTITPAALTISTNDVIKTYDGTTSANGTAIATAGTQLFGSDSLSSGSFAFTDKNAGTNKTVTVGGVTVSDGNSGNNYLVSYADNTTSTINQALLTANIVGNPTKVYDGTTTTKLTHSNFSLAGVVSGESVGIARTPTDGSYNSKNVSDANTITADLSGAKYTAGAGTLLSNYLLPTIASGSGQITPATLTYVANHTAMAQGSSVPPLSGTVTGFFAGETLGSATSGVLSWETNATSTSSLGRYYINGQGLVANYGNYVFVQDHRNATALTIKKVCPPQLCPPQ